MQIQLFVWRLWGLGIVMTYFVKTKYEKQDSPGKVLSVVKFTRDLSSRGIVWIYLSKS